MKLKKLKEGLCIAVPLSRGGHAVCVVARVSQRGGVVALYAFGPRLYGNVSPDSLQALRSCNALACIRAGDLSVREGTWPILGVVDPWHREAWALPDFVRRDPLSAKEYRVRYADDDACRVVLDVPMGGARDDLPEASLLGTGVAEYRLDQLLPTGDAHDR